MGLLLREREEMGEDIGSRGKGRGGIHGPMPV